MSVDSATPRYAFATAPLPLEAAFDGGRLTSDGGLPWLAEADAALGLSAAFAACLPEWRRGVPRHDVATLVRQRVYQIACGYADQDDADALRRDPLLKLVCGRLPDSGADLASPPTLSRLENAADRRACYRLASALVDLYVRERGRDGAPARILLDVDSTADPAHGRQEGAAYHGYYRQHMLHPLLVFDGDTGQLVAAVLRPGTAHASRGAVAVLKRLLARLRAQWPGVAVEVRADSGFASPALYTFCEAERVGYTVGLIPNPVLAALAAPLLAEAQQQAAADRLSCHRFLANQFRLLLHAAAYWLLDTLRRWLAHLGLARTQLDTLRLRLLKVGGRVYQQAARVRVRLASSHPGQPLWALLAARPGQP